MFEEYLRLWMNDTSFQEDKDKEPSFNNQYDYMDEIFRENNDETD